MSAQRWQLVVHDEGARLLVLVYEGTRLAAEIELSRLDAFRIASELLEAGLRRAPSTTPQTVSGERRLQ